MTIMKCMPGLLFTRTWPLPALLLSLLLTLVVRVVHTLVELVHIVIGLFSLILRTTKLVANPAGRTRDTLSNV